MEITLAILSFIVAVLAILQGWTMRQTRRNRFNPEGLNTITHKLEVIITQLGRMEQRLSDIWDRVKE